MISRNQPTCGVLYVATGTRHTDEMLRSAHSLRKQMPGLPIVLYTDRNPVDAQIFTEIRKMDQPLYSFEDKIGPLKESPFERTVLLDTDTYVCASVGDLFEILDRFDLAASHAPFRHDRPFATPNCFCELNTGVLAYRKTPEVLFLFDHWLRLYRESVEMTGIRESDQHAFRQALYESSVRLYVLPPEYNLRTVMPGFLGRGAVKILHGRGIPMERMERWVNRSRNIRVFLSSSLQLTRDHLEILSPNGRCLTALLTLFIQPLVRAEAALRFWKRRLFKIPK